MPSLPRRFREVMRIFWLRFGRHVDNDVPEAIKTLGDYYFFGHMGLVKSAKKAAKLWKRGVELKTWTQW
ncbi:hypothetical protein SO694_00087041 [Aureococcus anophagefferens]|uniref:Uncharacterized protein n=1 Tax=Aureococcus anophagefferens TaxID=44056 RepID=A0ABR1G4X8_AURAN